MVDIGFPPVVCWVSLSFSRSASMAVTLDGGSEPACFNGRQRTSVSCPPFTEPAPNPWLFYASLLLLALNFPNTRKDSIFWSPFSKRPSFSLVWPLPDLIFSSVFPDNLTDPTVSVPPFPSRDSIRTPAAVNSFVDFPLSGAGAAYRDTGSVFRVS